MEDDKIAVMNKNSFIISLLERIESLEKRATELETRREWKPDENTFGR